MKRKLLRQTYNERRTNLWMAVELLIVSVVIWFITDYLTSVAVTVAEPDGFNIERTFSVTTGQSAPESKHYVDYGEDAAEKNAEDLSRLYNALRNHPDIQAVSASTGAEPYCLNYFGSTWYREPDSMMLGARIVCVTPSHFDVFDYKPADSSVDVETLKEALRGGKVLITDFSSGFRNIQDPGLCAADLVGSRFSSDDMSYEIGGVIQYTKRRNLEIAGRDLVMLLPIDDNVASRLAQAGNFDIKVKAGKEKEFLSRFNALRDTHFRFGNSYISSIEPISAIKAKVNHESTVTTRKFVACMAFMLLSVFLGMLGTFWFRTRQRTPEIAIRKINGATNSSLFRRLVSEGLLLLTIVTPLAIIADWLICRYELNMEFAVRPFSTGRFIASVVITYLLMALIIFCGTLYPALRAMRIDPAEAIKDE